MSTITTLFAHQTKTRLRSALHSSLRLRLLLAFLFFLPLSHSLLLPHSLIVTLQCEQLRVCATLDNLPLVKHNNLIGVGDGRKSVTVTENLLVHLGGGDKRTGEF